MNELGCGISYGWDLDRSTALSALKLMLINLEERYRHIYKHFKKMIWKQNWKNVIQITTEIGSNFTKNITDSTEIKYFFLKDIFVSKNVWFLKMYVF